MTLSARQTQSQRQSLSARQLQAIALLGLTNEGLADHLARRAAANPLIRIGMPAGGAPPDAGDDLPAAQGGLVAHVLQQLPLILASPQDQPVALLLVEALNPNGWLDRSCGEIALGAGLPAARVAAVLARLQQGIEPTGLFARDLADCLRLQAAERGQLSAAMQALLDRLPLLADRGVAAVAEAAGQPEEAIAAAAARLRRLDPRPGLAFDGAPVPLRVPDVIVTRRGPGWHVALNRATLPALTILPGAAPELRAARNEAEWLRSVVERRNRTVLAVSRAVLLRQQGFLDHGPGALVALRRVEIAAELGLHDSTVGRVARDLLVETPHGLRSLCSLFGGGPVRAAAGPSPVASAAIRHRLAQLVAAEPATAPRSDAQLAGLLAQEGKGLARRTVSKFRLELGIPARALRRRAAP